MKLLKSKLRRTTAVVAGAIIGLGGVAFFASPASAHHSNVSGKAVCDTTTGEWTVNWSVDTVDYPESVKKFGLNLVEATPNALEPATDHAQQIEQSAKGDYPYTASATITGVQKVPGNARKATLTVQATWDNTYTETTPQKGTVVFDGKCGPVRTPKPSAQLASDCDGVTVTLANGEGATADARFTIKGSEGYKKNFVVQKGGDALPVTIPAKNAASIVVTARGSDQPILEGKWEQPKDCQSPEEVLPEGTYQATCDDLIFTIDNTKGTGTHTVVFTPNKGDAKTLTVKPGDKPAPVKFTGQKGLIVAVSEQGKELAKVDYDKEKPKDCTTAPPAAPGGEGGGDSLPVTGAAAGGIAGGAALLLAIGGVLFFMARRRKVKFTA